MGGIKKYSMFICFHALVVGFLCAETINLKDGSVIKGKVINASETSVELETISGVLNIDKTQIENISYQEEKIAPQSPQKENPQEEKSVTKANDASGSIVPGNRSFRILIAHKPSDSETDSGIYFEGMYMGDMNRNFSLGFGLGRSKYDNKEETLTQGNVTLTSVLARLRVKSNFKKGNVYFDAGPGFYII